MHLASGLFLLFIFFRNVSALASSADKMAASKTAAKMAKKWTQTASSYVRYFEPTTLVVGRFMLNCMRMQFQEHPLRVIEAGAGAGGLAKELCGLSGLSLEHLTVTDIADGMLEMAREKLQGLDKVTVEKADFNKFQYEDATFDRYYSNMCLHYADSPDPVIQEACRILKPGGICCFSVWGRSKDSALMTIVPDVLDELHLDPKDPNKRTSFHLGEDDEALRKKFLDRGFSRCTVIHYPGVIECFDPALYVECIIDGAASTKQQVESFSEEDQKRVRDEVFQRAKKILDQGKPMMLDMGIVVAQK